MKFEFSVNAPDKNSADIVVVFALVDEKAKRPTFIPLGGFTALDTVLSGQLSEVAKNEKFTGKRGDLLTVYPKKQILPTKIVIAGLGKASGFVADDLRRVMGRISKQSANHIDSIVLSLPTDASLGLDNELAMHMVTEGLLLGSYRFTKYKKDEGERHELTAVIISEQKKAVHAKLEASAKRAKMYAEATRVARDLVNETPTVATPTLLANMARDIAKSSPLLSVKVYDLAAAEKLGLEAFLGIARGAATPPKFIVLSYTPNRPKGKRKLALVGKGITFDSGGINLKPGVHMHDMKMDMAGAAAVLGVFSVIAELKPEFPVMGIIAATPNLISGNSIVPGDVVRALNGKTIEILNTDAEGRVTMADSLSYAVREKATEIIDLATLTGACMIALGENIAGLFPTDMALAERVKSAAHDAGEKVWEMPMNEDYKAFNKSEVADIANIPNTRYADAISAGLFLSEFVDKVPFVHLDIAGPAFSSKGTDISPKGGTGFGVRTMLHLLTEGEVS